jgi:hypothetical protein
MAFGWPMRHHVPGVSLWIRCTRLILKLSKVLIIEEVKGLSGEIQPKIWRGHNRHSIVC